MDFTIGINDVKRVRMNLDETGIYVYVQSSGKRQLFYLYYNNEVDDVVIENPEFVRFATTSPGTQPLPESM